MHKNSLICAINGVDNRNDAEALVGTVICVERETLPQTEEEEFYYVDLIGLEVRDEKGEILGDVRNVHNFGAQDLLDIYWRESQKTGFLPFTKAYVPTVDIKAGFIIACKPEGLTEAVKSGARRRRPSQK